MRKVLLLNLAAIVLLAVACSGSPVQSPEVKTSIPVRLSPVTVPNETVNMDPLQEALPKPISTNNSVEICMNSRYSEHRLTGIASNQQIANVLWAAGKAPVIGTHRNIYVDTTTGEYTYDPATHSMGRNADQKATGYKNNFFKSSSALVINEDSDLTFDTGVSYQLATLSSVSLCRSKEPGVTNCSVGTSLQFGVQNVKGLTSELVAHSSVPQSDPGWLPDPSTDGPNRFEEVLANLKYDSKFAQENLTLQQISQLLWAGYGCTPHTAVAGRRGLTVPSASANYYLTGKIYLINEKAVYRYQNRNPKTDLRTIDHRIEPITSSDVRDKLRAAVSSLPEAPCYIVICLSKTGIRMAQERDFALLETGAVAGNILVQASAIGLGCNFETTLTTDEQISIQSSTGIPFSDTPQVIISIGGVAK